MRVVFMGTPDFSVPCLVALVEAGHDVPLVVTQPDRPKGRGRSLQPTPVKQAALDRGLTVFQPERPNRDDAVAVIEAARPDVLVVVAYGAILKSRLLGLAPKGAVNVHASLLPRHRGMSPIHRAILDGDATTGITTMYMDEGVDTGDMILIEQTDIAPDETTGQLHDRLAVLGARLLVDTLAGIAAGTAPRTPQPSQGATYAGRIDKVDGVIDWSRPAAEVHNRIRAMTPAPGATGVVAGQPVLVAGSRVAEGSAAPGTILAVATGALRVATGSGAVDIHEIRPAGGRSMSAAAWARGRHIEPGARFEPAAVDRTPGAAR
jgi:methionyl-tRNA formyltransferase